MSGSGAAQHPGGAALPDGLVTFVFTDVEGSTRLLRRHGSAYAQMLAIHRELIRAAVERHRGVEIGTEGDSFFVAFRSGRDALAACIDAQHALRTHDWPVAPGLRVRMGLHTGEVEVYQNDYVGLAVNQAARIAAAAHGGQVLVSSDTLRLTTPLPDGASARSLGSFRLKDFDEPVELHQLVHRHLDRQFAPIRAAPAAAHNVTRRRTSFLGRDAELALLQRRLSTAQLLTLTGPGGAGKTRLAQELALSVASSFRDGIYLAELSAATDRSGVWAEVARVTDAGGAVGEPLDSAVPRVLARREMVLILDNCEHVIDEAAELAHTLLSSCHALIGVATSRERLAVEGEVVVPVEPLAPPGEDAELDDIIDNPAVQLFCDRAAAVSPSFDAAREMSAIASVCRRLDGLPLALELAAAQLTAFTVQELDQRLEDRFAVVVGGLRTAQPRQQTLRAVMDWGYELLDGRQKAALRALSVFAGPFDANWASAVWSHAGNDGNVPLGALVEKSLLVRDDDTYRFLETVRVYGREKLAETGGLDAAQRSHLAWVVNASLQGPDEPEATYVRRMDTMFAETRAAMTVATRDRLGPEVLSVCARAGRYLAEAQFLTGLGWMEAAVELSGQGASSDLAYVLARLAYMNSRWRSRDEAAVDRATIQAHDACRMFEHLDDPVGLCEALIILCSITGDAGAYDRAREAGQRASDLAQRHGLTDHRCRAEYNLGHAALYAGDTDEARRQFAVARSLTQDTYLRAWIELAEVEAAVSGGDPTGALAQLRALLSSLTLGGVQRQLEVVVVAGWACALEERWTDATLLFAAAEHIFTAQEIGDAAAWPELMALPARLTHHIERTRQALDTERYEQLSAEARQWDLARAIEYVEQLSAGVNAHQVRFRVQSSDSSV